MKKGCDCSPEMSRVGRTGIYSVFCHCILLQDILGVSILIMFQCIVKVSLAEHLEIIINILTLRCIRAIRRRAIRLRKTDNSEEFTLSINFSIDILALNWAWQEFCLQRV